MSALGALNKMYTLFYTLLVITLLFLLVAVGLTLYLHYAAV